MVGLTHSAVGNAGLHTDDLGSGVELVQHVYVTAREVRNESVETVARHA
jgi:hypothetical protein